MHVRKRRGLTQLEVILVTLAVIIFLVIIIITTLPRLHGNGPQSEIMDASQLIQFHKGMTAFARQFDGKLMRPGLINRIGNTPGRGEEDYSLNTTANIYSCMIAQNFILPQLAISTMERSPNVAVMSNYNVNAYQPAADVYWDETFAADLEKGSNVSYAHMPVIGKQGSDRWRDDLDSTWVLFGFRGPKDGITGTKSYTLQKDGTWAGNVCFSDGHIEYLKSTIYIDPETGKKDNLFKDEDGTDMILTFTKSTDGSKYEAQFD